MVPAISGDNMAVIQKRKILKPFSSTARSAGTDQTSNEIDCSNFSKISMLVDAQSVGGSPTSWTLDVKLEYSPDTSGSRWFDLPNGSITQLTAVGQASVDAKPLLTARRVRVSYTLAFNGGSSPTLTFEVDVSLTQQ